MAKNSVYCIGCILSDCKYCDIYTDEDLETLKFNNQILQAIADTKED